MRSDLLDLERVNDVLDAPAHGRAAALRAPRATRDAVLERHDRDALPRPELRHRHRRVPARRELTAGRLAQTLTDVRALEHRRLYGYDIPDEIVELVTFKVAAIGPTEQAVGSPQLDAAVGRPSQGRTRRLLPRRRTACPTAVYDRDAPRRRRVSHGPAVIEEAMSTTLVQPGQRVEVDDVRQPHPLRPCGRHGMSTDTEHASVDQVDRCRSSTTTSSRRRARWASRCATRRTRRSSTRGSTSRARSSTPRAR